MRTLALGGSEGGGDADGGRHRPELESSQSAYVFAGGGGADVGLYDLRMTPGSAGGGSSYSQVVQRYRPRALDGNKSSSVAVSGIDLSRDRRELLVSYESDHVYTFPIFGGNRNPTLDDIDGETDGTTRDKDEPVPEIAAYGGHLNRLTFLKMAKYAGPNDECEFPLTLIPSLFPYPYTPLNVTPCLRLGRGGQIFARAAIRATPGYTRRSPPPS